MHSDDSPNIYDSSWSDSPSKWKGSQKSGDIINLSDDAFIQSDVIHNVDSRKILNEVEKIMDDSSREISPQKKSLSIRTKNRVVKEVLDEIKRMAQVDYKVNSRDERFEGESLPIRPSLARNLGQIIKEMTHKSMKKYLKESSLPREGLTPIVVNYENTYNYYFGNNVPGKVLNPKKEKDISDEEVKIEASEPKEKETPIKKSTNSEPEIAQRNFQPNENPRNQPKAPHQEANPLNPIPGQIDPPSDEFQHAPSSHPNENFDPRFDPPPQGYYYKYPPQYGYPYQDHSYLNLPYQHNQLNYSIIFIGIAIIFAIICVGLTVILFKFYKKNLLRRRQKYGKRSRNKKKSRRKEYRWSESETESESDFDDSEEEDYPKRRRPRHSRTKSSKSRHYFSKTDKSSLSESDDLVNIEVIIDQAVNNTMMRNQKINRRPKKITVYQFYDDNNNLIRKMLKNTSPIPMLTAPPIINNTSIGLGVSDKFKMSSGMLTDGHCYQYKHIDKENNDESPHNEKTVVDFEKSDKQSKYSATNPSVKSQKISMANLNNSQLNRSDRKSFKKKKNYSGRLNKLSGLQDLNTVKSQNYLDNKSHREKRREILCDHKPQIHRSLYFDKQRSKSIRQNQQSGIFPEMGDPFEHFINKKSIEKSYELYKNDDKNNDEDYLFTHQELRSGEISKYPLNPSREENSYEMRGGFRSKDVQHEHCSKDFFNELKKSMQWNEEKEEVIELKRNMNSQRKTSEIIGSHKKQKAFHKRTKSQKCMVAPEKFLLKKDFKEDYDQNKYSPVIVKPALKENNRYQVEDNDSDEAGPEHIFNRTPIVTYNKGMFSPLNQTPNFKQEEDVREAFEFNLSKEKPEISTVIEPKFVENISSFLTNEKKNCEFKPDNKRLSTDKVIYSTFHSSLMEKLQNQKNKHPIIPNIKTQINIYDKDLKLKNFMYENGKFENSFQKLKTIGRGSFGKVFLAKHLLECQDYAIKQIKLKLTPKGELLTNNFQKEIRAMAVLQNKNVVRFFTSWMEEEMDIKRVGSKVTSIFKVSCPQPR